jgi:E3 ubiquitin-protein ligase TRIP12
LGPTLEFYALVSTELQRAELGLWNDSDSYKHQKVMAEIVKTPAIPAIPDDMSTMIYIQQPSSAVTASSVTSEDSSGNNNTNSDNNVINNNEINMLMEQSLDFQNEASENQSSESLLRQCSICQCALWIVPFVIE